MKETIHTGQILGTPEAAPATPEAIPAPPAVPEAPPQAPETGLHSDSRPVPPAPADLNALLNGDKALQSQFDKLVAKALDTARGKWEAQRNMSAQELADQRAQEREAELSSREAELTRRELRASALGLMSQRGMPPELIDCVSLADEGAMAQSLEQAEQAFRAAVDRAVKDKLKGGPPKDAPADTETTRLAAMRAAAGLKG